MAVGGAADLVACQPLPHYVLTTTSAALDPRRADFRSLDAGWYAATQAAGLAACLRAQLDELRCAVGPSSVWSALVGSTDGRADRDASLRLRRGRAKLVWFRCLGDHGEPCTCGDDPATCFLRNHAVAEVDHGQTCEPNPGTDRDA